MKSGARLCVLTAAVLFGANSRTLAADAGDEPVDPAADTSPATMPETAGDTITVTATRNARDRATTPVSVGVIDDEELAARQPRDLGDVMKYQPGVEVNGTANSYDQGPVIRGLDGDRVLVLLDGTRLNFGSGHKGEIFVEPAWLRRVEVVRGPGSALYGSDALGGVFSMDTLDPVDLLDADDLLTFQQRLGYAGNNDEFRTLTTLAGRLAREGAGSNVEYLLGIGHREAGGNYRSGDGEIAYSEESPSSGIAKLVWWLSGADRLELSWQGYRLDTEPEPDIQRETVQNAWRLDYDHDGDNPLLHLKLSLYYTDLQIDEDDSGATPDEERIDFSTLGVNAQNSSEFELGDAHALTLTYGADWYRDEQRSSVDGGDNLFFPRASADSYALFAQVELSLWDELLTIIPGIRQDWYEREAEGQDDLSDDALSLKLGATLKLDDEIGMADGDYLVLHGSYGEGFRTPSFGELYIGGPHFVIPTGPGTFYYNSFEANPELSPESSETVEAGVRVKVGEARFAATLFRTEAKDFIDYTVSTAFSMGNIYDTLKAENIDSATITGLELEADYQLGDWRFWANYTRIRGDNEETDEPLSSIAPDALKAGIDWRHPELGLVLGGQLRWYDDFDRAPSGVDEQDGFVLLDLSASWTPTPGQVPDWAQGLSVGLGLENVTDENYTWFTGTQGRGLNPVISLSYTRSW